MKHKKSSSKLAKMMVINSIERIPFLGSFLLYVIRRIKFWVYYKPIFLAHKIFGGERNPFRVVWVNPADIVYVSGIRRSSKKKINIGTTKGGGWDQSGILFNDLDTYQSLRERFVEHKEWEDTEYFQEALKRVLAGEMPWMCRTKKDLQERTNNLDLLFEQIKKHGISDSAEDKVDVYSYKDKLTKQSNKSQAFLDYILIDISRNGDPLFVDGGHRLAIANILHIPTIPALVRIRHKEWASFRKEMEAYAKSLGGYLYQKLYHFDLEHIPFSHGNERIQTIRRSTNLTSGTVLDIGAYLGLHCHVLEDAGFRCTAIETNPTRVHLMKKLRDAVHDSFDVMMGSILLYKKESKLSFDMVLVLNIFHHFLKDESTFIDLQKLLRRLECKELFFETHNPSERQMQPAFKNFTPDEFVDFILLNSVLKHSELLEEVQGGRRLYRLYV